MKPVPILVPRRTATAVVRMIGNQRPRATIRLNGSLRRASHSAQQRRTRRQMRAVQELPRITTRHHHQHVRQRQMRITRSRRHVPVDHLKYGFSSVNTTGLSKTGPLFGPPGYEINLLYIAGLFALTTSNPVPLSVDRWLERLRAQRAAQ